MIGKRRAADPESASPLHERFRQLARATSEAVGSPLAFSLGVAITGIWACLGPAFDYSDTWQLVINTGTTIATFLIVFLIQHTQNRDARVIQLKLDELIRAVVSARTELVNMETLSDTDLDVLQRDFERLRDRAAAGLEQISARKRKSGDGRPSGQTTQRLNDARAGSRKSPRHPEKE